MSQKAVTDLLGSKLDANSVVQTTGNSEEKVMSQKAVTDVLASSSTGFLKYQGKVEAVSDLPSNLGDSQIGYLYAVEEDGHGYYWFEDKWNLLDFDVDLSKYYTKTETDSKLSNYYDKTKIDSDYYTKSAIDSEFSNYYDKTDTDSKLSNYYDKTKIDSDYYTKSAIDSEFSNYYDKSEINADFSNYYTKPEIDLMISSSDSGASLQTSKTSELSVLKEEIENVSGKTSEFEEKIDGFKEEIDEFKKETKEEIEAIKDKLVPESQKMTAGEGFSLIAYSAVCVSGLFCVSFEIKRIGESVLSGNLNFAILGGESSDDGGNGRDYESSVSGNSNACDGTSDDGGNISSACDVYFPVFVSDSEGLNFMARGIFSENKLYVCSQIPIKENYLLYGSFTFVNFKSS
jgi:hypothetical protein